MTGFAQNEDGVDVELSDGRRFWAEYLVGCDGGRSLIRKAAGIEFPGWDATTSWLIAEAEVADEPPWGFLNNATGSHAIGKLEEPKRARVVLTEQQVGSPGEPTLRDISEGLIAVYGTDYGIHNPTWISRFTDMTRQAAAYREGRVLLASDAAHVHPPVGGQGLNLGEPGGLDITPWTDRVQSIDARYAGAWELSVLGAVTAPEAVLIRPDGYVAWVGDVTQRGLTHALTTWFGPPTTV